MSITSKFIGSRIRQIRLKKKISLTCLSYMADIEYSHLSKIEFGKMGISIIQLFKITTALDICIVCLFVKSDLSVDLIESKESINIYSIYSFKNLIDNEV